MPELSAVTLRGGWRTSLHRRSHPRDLLVEALEKQNHQISPLINLSSNNKGISPNSYCNTSFTFRQRKIGKAAGGSPQESIEWPTDILFKKDSHNWTRSLVEMLPGALTFIHLPIALEERCLELEQLWIRRRVEHHENGYIATLLTISRKSEFLFPPTLATRSNRHTKLEFIGTTVRNTINLSPFPWVIVSPNGTSRRAHRCSTNSPGDNGLEEVSCFLGRTIIDIEDPLTPEEKRG